MVGAACALVLASCRRAPAPVDAPTRIDALDFAGCDAIVAGPVCELGEARTLHVWLPPGDELVGAAAGATSAALAPTSVAVGGGTRVTLDVPRGATSLAVRLRRGGADAAWTLRLAEAAPLADSVTDARRLRREGKPADAAERLRAALPTLAGKDAAVAVGLLGRIALARGDVAEAARALDEAIERHAALGRASDAADDASVLAYAMVRDRRFQDARDAIARARRWSTDYAEGRAHARYNEGLLAQDTADARSALRALYDAESEAARIAYDDQRRNAVIARGLLLLRIGRAREALASLRDLAAKEAEAMPPCSRADLWHNLGWITLVAHGLEPDDPRAPPLDDARPILEKARALYTTCGRTREEANSASSLAQAEIDRGDPAAARAHLDEARRLLPTPDGLLRIHWMHIDARIALALGRAKDALGAFDAMARVAAAVGSVEDEWRAVDGRAEALAAMGKRDLAIAASVAADALLDDAGRLVPIGEGRGTFLGARERSARRRVALLVDGGRAAEALDVARRARARVVADLRRFESLSQLDAASRARWENALAAYRRGRDELAAEAAGDWSLSAQHLEDVLASRRERERKLRASLEEVLSSTGARADAALPALVPGEVLLAYHAVERGWVGFAARDGRVVAKVLAVDPRGPHDALARALLDPFAAQIRGAERVRVLSHGALRAVDFHALPFDGAPLVARAPVAYGVDLGGAGVADGVGAAIVADPTGDLPATRAEARAVVDALGEGALVIAGDRATAPRVRDALSTARLFHYAGHGVFGGRDGWESALPLAAGGALSVGDVVALARVPPLVVLSGCETARTDEASQSEGPGLAQAFLVAGAREVVAATRPVDDAATARWMRALYASASMARGDLAAALRDAHVTALREGWAGDGAAFRALRR